MSLDPFVRMQKLFEAKAKLTSTICSLTKKKKYVKFSDLKSNLGLDDDAFNSLIGDAKKANRHSNKYIFTSVDDEDAVGITALKRGKKKSAANAPEANPGYGLAHRTPNPVNDPEDKQSHTKGKTGWNPSDPGPIPGKYLVWEHRSKELWSIWAKESWKGLDKRGLLPEGWQKMSGTQIVESILDNEFKKVPSVVDINRIIDLVELKIKRIGYALNYTEKNPSVGDSHRATRQQWTIGGELTLMVSVDVDDNWNWKFFFELLDDNGDSLAADTRKVTGQIPNEIVKAIEPYLAELPRNPAIPETF